MMMVEQSIETIVGTMWDWGFCSTNPTFVESFASWFTRVRLFVCSFACLLLEHGSPPPCATLMPSSRNTQTQERLYHSNWTTFNTNGQEDIILEMMDVLYEKHHIFLGQQWLGMLVHIIILIFFARVPTTTCNSPLVACLSFMQVSQ